ncbi:MAG: hypothetical protein K2N72_03880 [Oscillospiraceae bacterium]|nr:hypothetical protein [Oscillospiraceae bacterium]
MLNIIANKGDASALPRLCALTGGSMKCVTFVTHFYAAAPPDFYFFGDCEIRCFA